MNMELSDTSHHCYGPSLGDGRTFTCSDPRHDEAVLRAEVNRVVRALAPYRVLSRDVLRREAGAGNWHEPRFERALEAAVEQGRIEALPLGFYGCVTTDAGRASDLTRGRRRASTPRTRSVSARTSGRRPRFAGRLHRTGAGT